MISRRPCAWPTPEQVARVLADLGDAGIDQVDVVVTVRDLARQLPAEWQEGVKHGRRDSYPAFLRHRARRARRHVGTDAERRRHRRFWAAQDPVAVLDRWGAHLPADRVHCVVDPPPGAPSDELWRRFAAALGVAVDRQRRPCRRRAVNPSLGRDPARGAAPGQPALHAQAVASELRPVAKRLYAGRILRGQRGARLTLPGRPPRRGRRRWPPGGPPRSASAAGTSSATARRPPARTRPRRPAATATPGPLRRRHAPLGPRRHRLAARRGRAAHQGERRLRGPRVGAGPPGGPQGTRLLEERRP